jgi:hypothetical protein
MWAARMWWLLRALGHDQAADKVDEAIDKTNDALGRA